MARRALAEVPSDFRPPRPEAARGRRRRARRGLQSVRGPPAPRRGAGGALLGKRPREEGARRRFRPPRRGRGPPPRAPRRRLPGTTPTAPSRRSPPPRGTSCSSRRRHSRPTCTGFFRLLEILRPDAYRSPEEFTGVARAGRAAPARARAPRGASTSVACRRASRFPSTSRGAGAGGTHGRRGEDLADPRVEWLVAECRAAHRAARRTRPSSSSTTSRRCQSLKARLESATREARGDLPRGAVAGAAATSRWPSSAGRTDRSCLVSTECGRRGAELRVLPDDSSSSTFRAIRRAVEQRIGRLDRINRTTPVEIVYFRPPKGFGARARGALRADRPLPRAARRPRAVARARRGGGREGRAVLRRRAGTCRSRTSRRRCLRRPRTRQEAVYHHLHVGGFTGRDGGRNPLARPAGAGRVDGAIRPRRGAPLRLRDGRAAGEADLVRRARRRTRSSTICPASRPARAGSAPSTGTRRF